MPDLIKTAGDAKKSAVKSQTDNSKVKPDDQGLSQVADQVPVKPVSKPVKEQEPAVSAETALAEIQEREKEAAQEAERKIQKELGQEARLREPEPVIPPDVKDAGVISPEEAATETIDKGATINLPVSENTYEEGKHTKITAKVTQKREVYGIKSIIALALFVGKLIKLAHHHAKRIVFKKSSQGKVSEDKEGG